VRQRGSESPDLNQNDILTAEEVADDLRCSKAHVYKALNGRVPGVSPLPAISMGRRKLVRRGSLEQWKRENEHGGSGAMIASSLKENAVGA
jgi:hypothetical protein